jgi:hypothetical protein
MFSVIKPKDVERKLKKDDNINREISNGKVTQSRLG